MKDLRDLKALTMHDAQRSAFRVLNSVLGAGARSQGLGCRVDGVGFRHQGVGVAGKE